MNYFKHMIHTLHDKPVIGIIAAFSSGAFVAIKNFLTDDKVLGTIAIIGAWLGFIIAILTGIIKIIELVRLVRNK